MATRPESRPLHRLRRGSWRIWDNKDLSGHHAVLPCIAPAAFFEVGDGHPDKATAKWTSPALETSLIGTFQFIVRKDMHLKCARRKPTHYITMGLNDDLNAGALLPSAR